MKALIRLRALIFTAVITLIVILPFFAEGSQIRVDSLGFSGLMPDMETDLKNNPAYLYLLRSSCIFTGLDFYYNKYENGDYHAANIDTNSYLEYCSIGERFKASLRYEPIYSKDKYNNAGSPSLIYKQSGWGNFTARIGLHQGNKVDTAIKLKVNNLTTKENGENRGKNKDWQLELGTIYRPSDSLRVGIVFSVEEQIDEVF